MEINCIDFSINNEILPTDPKQNTIQQVCLQILAQNNNASAVVSQELKKKDISVGSMLKRDPSYLLYLLIIARNGLDFQYIPTSSLTSEMCLFAVQQDVRALQHVPLNMITEEMCLFAVQQDAKTLEHVPLRLITQEMCRIACIHGGQALQFVPKIFFTQDLEGERIYNIPGLLTRELCRQALYTTPNDFRWIPETLRSPEMYITLLLNHGI